VRLLCYKYSVLLEQVAEINEVIVTKTQCWGCIRRSYLKLSTSHFVG